MCDENARCPEGIELIKRRNQLRDRWWDLIARRHVPEVALRKAQDEYLQAYHDLREHESE